MLLKFSTSTHITVFLTIRSEWKPKINMSTAPLVWHHHEATVGGWQALNQLCDGMRCWDGVYEVALKRLLQTATLHRQMERLISLREAMGTSRKQSEAMSSVDLNGWLYI